MAMDLIWWNLQISFAIFVIEIVIEKLGEIANRSVAEETTERFFSLLFDKIIHAPIPTYFDVTPLSRIMSHFHCDLRAFDMYVLEMMFEFFVQIQMISFAAYQVMISVPILAIIIPAVAIRNFRKDIRNKAFNEKRDKAMRVFYERLDKINNSNFEGSSLIRAFGNQHLIVKDIRKVSMQRF